MAKRGGGTGGRASSARRASTGGSRRAGPTGRVVRLRVPGPGASAYSVRIGPGLLDEAGRGVVERGTGVLVVADAALPGVVVERVLAGLERLGARAGVVNIRASEEDKSLETLSAIVDAAARHRLERGDVMAALGGGVAGDVAGFAAAVYRRGVRLLQCPTTLLAMVDASVGGKTGVNLWTESGPGGQGAGGERTRRGDAGRGEGGGGGGGGGRPRLLKNMVGAFHQPAGVVCDPDVLTSLPGRELRSGLAECVKHAVLGPGLGEPDLLSWMEARAEAVLALRTPVITELIARNVALKARVVQKDPFEQSPVGRGGGTPGRMALNLGHTFAHVLEGLEGLSWRDHAGREVTGTLTHGEAVGLGVIAACRTGTALRWSPAGLEARVRALLDRLGLPTRVAGLPETLGFIERLRDDKKVSGRKLRLIVPTGRGGAGRGRVRVVIEPATEAIEAALDALRA